MNEEEKELRFLIASTEAVQAMNVIKSYGFSIIVPGCFDIETKEQLIDYIMDENEFYQKMESGLYENETHKDDSGLNRPEYNYESAAAWLNITPHKLRRLVSLRKISFVKMGREVRFSLEDLEQYVTGCVRPAVYEAGVSLTTPPGIGTSRR